MVVVVVAAAVAAVQRDDDVNGGMSTGLNLKGVTGGNIDHSQ